MSSTHPQVCPLCDFPAVVTDAGLCAEVVCRTCDARFRVTRPLMREGIRRLRETYAREAREMCRADELGREVFTLGGDHS